MADLGPRRARGFGPGLNGNKHHGAAEARIDHRGRPVTPAEPTQQTEAVADRPPFPPVVYVPTTPDGDVASRRVLMHRVADGRTALYTYSAIDRLHSIYLPDHPWVLCDVAALQRIHDQTPYDLLFLDVDPGLRDDPGDVPADATGSRR